MTAARRPVAEVLAHVLGDGLPLAIEAYDGSKAGPADPAVRIEIRTPRALNYVVTSPGELGLARAYIAGDLELHGDAYTALMLLLDDNADLAWTERIEVLRALGLRTLQPVEPPPEEVKLRGWRHSRRRDRSAIAHHYDVSNRFYGWVLGESMTYTCAVFDSAETTLEQAQEAKHELVARKLGLTEGMRLLDVGCGWGGMVLHAAQKYGVRALGVTLSAQQAEFGQKRIAEAGLGDLAEVRFQDYRDVSETDFDVISSIGLTEHIGERELGSYFGALLARLRPQGRLLNHCITRPSTTEPVRSEGFIDRYVFPDGELMGVGRIASVMQDTGFELRHMEDLREHYALTLKQWCANLDANWDAAVAEVGLARAKVWKLYMAGSRIGFEKNTIQLHQLLGVKSTGGNAGMPLRPAF